MKGIYQHIAFALLGIFVLPIVFQSVHIAYTHHNYTFCSTHFESVDRQTTQEDHSAKYETDHGAEHCLICEYEFAINTLPEPPIFRCLVPRIILGYNENVISKPSSCIAFIKSSRAPPHTSLYA